MPFRSCCSSTGSAIRVFSFCLDDSHRSYAGQVASTNQLRFLETQSLLSETSESSTISSRAFKSLHESLDREYRLLSYLLNHAANYQAGGQTFENRLLAIDYFLISLWYKMVCGVSDRLARMALLEMSSIIGHLANEMGHQVATSTKL